MWVYLVPPSLKQVLTDKSGDVDRRDKHAPASRVHGYSNSGSVFGPSGFSVPLYRSAILAIRLEC